MPTVFLTRPRASAERLAARLGSLGYTSVIEPMLTIMPTGALLPVVDNAAAVMITSSNVFPVLEKDRQGALPLLEMPCFCIGTATAEQAADFGFRDVFNAAGDGTSLAELIRRTFSGHSLLHIAGEDVDGSAQDELRVTGFTVTVWPIYSAVRTTALSEKLTALLRGGKIDSTLVFSARSATTLSNLLTRHGLEACCQGMTTIGMSDNVTTQLAALPWKKLVAATDPNEDSVIECLHQFVSVENPP